jgi:hypothetical protein
MLSEHFLLLILPLIGSAFRRARRAQRSIAQQLVYRIRDASAIYKYRSQMPGGACMYDPRYGLSVVIMTALALHACKQRVQLVDSGSAFRRRKWTASHIAPGHRGTSRTLWLNNCHPCRYREATLAVSSTALVVSVSSSRIDSDRRVQ